MKASIDRAATRQVLADIDAVLRERTAEAVERVLRTASSGESCVGPFEGCDCLVDEIEPDDATPGLTVTCADPACDCKTTEPLPRQAKRYAPWVVSPHLLGGGS